MSKDRYRKVPLLIAASLVVACIWTFLTGDIWHWLPICGAIVVTLGLLKATRQ